MAHMNQVMERLLDDHARMRRIFELFETELACFSEGGSADYDVLAGALDLLSEYLDVVHHPMEDRMLECLGYRNPAAAAAASALERDHRKLEDLTLQVSRLFAAVRDDTIASRQPLCELGNQLLESYREHMEWEEGNLFPAGRQALTSEDWEGIWTAAEAGPNPLREVPISDRFAALLRRLDVSNSW